MHRVLSLVGSSTLPDREAGAFSSGHISASKIRTISIVDPQSRAMPTVALLYSEFRHLHGDISHPQQRSSTASAPHAYVLAAEGLQFGI
jgi:hypothetical protein